MSLLESEVGIGTHGPFLRVNPKVSVSNTRLSNKNIRWVDLIIQEHAENHICEESF